MDNQNITEAQVIQELTIRSLPPQTISTDAQPFIVTPDNCTIVNLEEYLPRPTRKRGTIQLYDSASFIATFNAHKNPDSHIYYKKQQCIITAVFNDDGISSTGWKDHKAIYQCPLSTEWQVWSSHSGRKQNQSDFAEFIENNLPDIYSDKKDQPTAAQLLEVATHFKVNKKVTFASAKRLDNGQVSLEYVEDIQGSGGPKGSIKVPEKFWIAIPIFENGDIYQLECRFKYFLKEGQLSMWFDLYRAEKVKDAAFENVLKTISEGCSVGLINGSI